MWDCFLFCQMLQSAVELIDHVDYFGARNEQINDRLAVVSQRSRFAFSMQFHFRRVFPDNRPFMYECLYIRAYVCMQICKYACRYLAIICCNKTSQKQCQSNLNAVIQPLVRFSPLLLSSCLLKGIPNKFPSFVASLMISCIAFIFIQC